MHCAEHLIITIRASVRLWTWAMQCVVIRDILEYCKMIFLLCLDVSKKICEFLEKGNMLISGGKKETNCKFLEKERM